MLENVEKGMVISVVNARVIVILMMTARKDSYASIVVVLKMSQAAQAQVANEMFTRKIFATNLMYRKLSLWVIHAMTSLTAAFVKFVQEIVTVTLIAKVICDALRGQEEQIK